MGAFMTTPLRTYLAESRSILRNRLLHLMPEAGAYPTGIDGFALYRFNSDERPKPLVYHPILVVVVQGKKWVRIGTKEFIYGDHTCFVAGIDMPVFCCVKEASLEKPYLALTMDLDRNIISRLISQTPLESGHGGLFSPAAQVQGIDDPLLDACLRILQLVDKPQEIGFLAPLFREEIHYRLLLGPFGGQLRALYTAGSQGSRMAKAINWLHRNFKQPVRVETLAGEANMATSTFHKNFKSVTTFSPLQYQKRLRLSEAQRLILSENFGVTEAAFAVGYESATQFSREYKRLFGVLPSKDTSQAL